MRACVCVCVCVWRERKRYDDYGNKVVAHALTFVVVETRDNTKREGQEYTAMCTLCVCASTLALQHHFERGDTVG